MSGITRDGDGMEPPKSTSDDNFADGGVEPHPDDAFTIEANGEETGDGKGEEKLDEVPNGDLAHDGNNHPDLDPDEDADLLTVEQWLAEAENGVPNGVGTVKVGSGQNMSDIMAELLAAAEESEGDVDPEPQEVAADSDTEQGVENETDAVANTETDTENDTENDGEGEEDGRAGAESDTDASYNVDQPSPDDEAIDLDQIAKQEATIDLDTLDGKDEASTEAGEEAKPATEDKANVEAQVEEPAKAEAESAGDQPTPPTLPVKETTTEVKTSQRSILVPKVTEPKGPFPIGRVLIGVAVGLYLLLGLAWILDSLAHRGEAMRGVEIASVDVGGADAEALKDTIDTLNEELAAKPLEVAIGDSTIETNPVALGAELAGETMVEEALAAKRGGFVLLRPFTWLGDLFSTVSIEPRYLVNADTAASATVQLIDPELAQPIEPTLDVDGDEIVVNPGSPGVAVASDEIVDKLADRIDSGEPYRLQLTPLDSNPELDTSSVVEMANSLNQRTERAVSVRVLDDEAEVSPRTLKSWIEMTVEDGEPGWAVNEELALEDLKPLFPTLGSEEQQATFTIVDGEPLILPAAESVVCCAEGSGDILRRIIKRPFPTPVTEEDEEGNEVEVDPLRLADLEPIITGNTEGVAELESLGIIEEISTFTTKHACCQNRVKNIQRFADLMQGVVIRPGEELSLNGHVGQRTIDKGFVADGAISLGNFEKQVGGGISQYATTFFNTAFFAGIEFLEYQSHSIYISRYPRGREATISWRRPDLKVLNNTEYGILVWNEYTPTSITVTFYSTKHLEVEALDRRRSSDRQCRIDITPRLITFPDGTEVEDSVFALYRPGEGLDCNGDSTTPEEEEEEPEPAPATTPPPPTTTPPPPEPTPPGGGEVVPPPGG